MITQFIQYLTAIRGYSGNTAIAYEKDLRTFAKYINSERTGKRWSTITREDVDQYIIYLSTNGKSAATINRHLSAISSLYNYMKREGLEVDNPCKYESRKKLAIRVVNTIPVADLEAAAQQGTPTQRVILHTLMATGIRAQELLDLMTTDIDVRNHSLRVRGKGMKERLVPTTTANVLELLQYSGKKIGRIFGNMTQRELRTEVWKALRNVSSAKQLSPHAIRHTFATEMTRAGMPTTTLAEILGHNSVDTTQKYVSQAQVNTAAAYNQFYHLN